MSGKPEIGFMGLGLMGSAMVGRLQDLDYPLTVIANRSRANVEAAVSRGAREVATAREVAEASDFILLCMATSDQVESRMRGPDGVIAGLSDGKIVIDFGTSLPGSTRALAEEVAEVKDAATAAQDRDINERLKVRTLEERQKSIQDDVEEIKQEQKEQSKKLDKILEKLTVSE